MKNDYLWDKTGSDAEIEGLEGLLVGYKYQADAPPAVRAAVAIVPVERMAWWKLSLAFAVPACLLIAIGIGIAFWASRPANVSRSAAILREVPVVTAPTVQTEPETGSNVATVASPKPVRASAIPPRETRVKAVHRKQKKRFNTLTAEEKFAYEQLLLALSITGSKLKVVTDTVKGTED